jgi:mono/diheme cytochrome c family protein
VSVRLIAAFALLAGCNEASLPVPGFTLEQMNEQPRYQVWEASPRFADGRAMQPPPEATIAREAIANNPAFTAGMVDGRYVDAVPLPLSRQLFADGRRHFEIACAPCHGFDGSGRSIVASKMRLRRPPSLVDEAARALQPGRIFQVVTRGYGLMPPLYDVLSANARWQVVAYLRALQLSRALPLASLPPAERARLEKALP